MLYVAGFRPGMSYNPVAPLSDVLTEFVAGSVRVIFAPATTAPVWSVTMPVSSELACANAPAHAKAKISGNRMYLYLACLM